MDDYNKQAKEFCEKNGVKIEAKFVAYDKHFSEDKEKRDIYEITITRNELRPWTFRFGQSIAMSQIAEKRKDVIRYYEGINHTVVGNLKQNLSRMKKCKQTSQYCYRKYSIDIERLVESGAPTEYDILACITKSDPGLFEDFCSDYGYDDDSIRAKRTYEGVREEWVRCERMFSDVMEELQEIC